MSVIYEPKGAAREYAAAALNVYQGCSHGCLYSYNVRRLSPAQVREYRDNPKPRQAVVTALNNGSLAREALEHVLERPHAPVFLSFTSDPYQPCEAEHGLTRRVLRVLVEAGCRVMILTKAGSLAQRDLDILADAPWHHALGVTLITLSRARAEMWEPGAALPIERLGLLRAAKIAGLLTFVSLEPVIYPDATLEAIRGSHHLVDHYAVGKLNHWSLARVRQVDPQAQAVDWPSFRRQVSELLESLGYRRGDIAWDLGTGRTYYIKRDLAVTA